METKTYYQIQTIQNAMKILRLYSVDNTEFGVREIAKKLEISKTTAHRLISTLAQEGFLRKNPETNRYQLGMQLLTLSGIIKTHFEMNREAQPILEELVNDVGETVLIGILEDTKVTYLSKVECKHPVRLQSFVGISHPSYCTGSGKAILAYQPEKIVDKVIRNGLYPHTSKTIADPTRLRKDLRDIRHNGYCVSMEEMYEGVVSIGVPIWDYSNQVIASLAVVGPDQRILKDKIPYYVKMAMLAGGRISKKLGY